MSNNNGFIGETIYFWRKVLSNPVRLIAMIAFLGIVWVNNGWIFHPISSIITTVISAIIIIGASGYFFKLTGIQIDWNNASTQKTATSLCIAIPVVLLIYNVLKGNLIFFTVIAAIIAAVIVLIALKDSIFK